MGESYIDPEIADYQKALSDAWVLIGRLDMALELISNPHVTAKDKREIITKVRADIRRASVSTVVS